ncbi:CLUMA_CG009797, isoform A [Clunio marinus]|uniref:CLUMA_CG009797, isoform A n=1 Tax=Clunio marinus TaxID=568069 RepID=A0A1J1I9Y3_9DIPT|nr:CLUMA_CG009797, isoform A [Clunio marinus]
MISFHAMQTLELHNWRRQSKGSENYKQYESLQRQSPKMFDLESKPTNDLKFKNKPRDSLA